MPTNKYFENIESSSLDVLESLTTTIGLTKKQEVNVLKKSFIKPEALIQKQTYKEMLIMKKNTELKELKKQEMKRILKVFSTVPPSSRKALLPKIIPALFGENFYGSEIMNETSQ